MTGTNLYVNKSKQSRSYLNHLVYLAVLWKRKRRIRQHHLFFFKNRSTKRNILQRNFEKQDKRLGIDLLYFHLCTRNFLISTTR